MISTVPVDLAFTVATTATADLFGNRATTNVSAGAGGNDAVKAITDGGFTVASFGLTPPTGECWLASYHLETDTPCVVQIGLLNAAGDAFVPLDTHVCTTVAGGGIVRGAFVGSGPRIPLGSDGRLALRVSEYGAETEVRVAGYVEVYRS